MASQNYKKRIGEVSYFPMKGFTATPPAIAEPDRLVECENFYIETEGVLVSRPGLSRLGSFNTSDLDNPVINSINFTPSSGGTVSVILKGRRVYVYNPSTELISTLTYSGSELILDSVDGFKDLVEFGGSVYIVQGDSEGANASKILYWDGTGTTITGEITLPKVSTYGNPVSIESLFGRLFVVTDKGYLRYCGVNTATVWEDRVLMSVNSTTGVINATAGNTTLTGVKTTFETNFVNTAATAYTAIVITDGTNEEYLYIADVATDTSLTVHTAPVNNYTNATWYVVGVDYYEPIAPDSALRCRMIRKFADYLAVTRTSDDVRNTASNMTYLKIQPQADTQILLVTIKDLGNNYDIHPYAMIEYESMLVFSCSNGVYALQSATVFETQNIQPTVISKNKLERVLQEIDLNYKNNSRITKIKNSKYNLLLASFTEQGSTLNNVTYSGYLYQESGFEWTKMKFNTYNFVNIDTGATDTTETFDYTVETYGYLVLFGGNQAYKLFDTTQTVQEDEIWTEISVNCSDNLSTYGCSLGGDPDWYINEELINCSTGGKTTDTAITYSLKTGNTSFNLFDRMKINKMYVTTSEIVSTTGFTDSYKIYIVTDSFNEVLNYDKEFLGRSISQYSFDRDTITADTIEVTGDNDLSLTAGELRAFPIFCPLRNVNNIALKIENTTSNGVLDFRGYGITLTQSKYTG